MKKVKMLSIFFTDVNDPDKDVSKDEFYDMLEFVKDCGFVPEEDTIRFAPVVVEFILKNEISIDDAMNLYCEIEAAGKYEVVEFRFSTEYGGFDEEEPPYAGIYVAKK